MTRRAQRTLATVLAIAVAVTIVEGALRYFSPERLIAKDAARGWALRPGARTWAYFEASRVWVRINRDGLFDRERAVDAAPGTRRVAMLGDSYLSMFNLSLERTFVPLLESSLNACGPRSPIEAINFGVPAYGTGQELLTYRLHARRYRPDVVVLAFFLGNDLTNSYRPLEPTGVAPTYEMDNGALRYVPAPPETTAPDPADLPLHHQVRLFLTRRLKTATVLWDAWARLRNGLRSDVYPEMRDQREDLPYRPPTTPVDVEAWRVTEKLIETLAGEVAADGAEFWLLILPTPEQVHPLQSVRQGVARRFNVASLSYADERLQTLARDHHWPAISLVGSLADYAQRTEMYLHGGLVPEVPKGIGHWNEDGNRVAADMVARELCGRSEALAH